MSFPSIRSYSEVLCSAHKPCFPQRYPRIWYPWFTFSHGDKKSNPSFQDTAFGFQLVTGKLWERLSLKRKRNNILSRCLFNLCLLPHLHYRQGSIGFFKTFKLTPGLSFLPQTVPKFWRKEVPYNLARPPLFFCSPHQLYKRSLRLSQTPPSHWSYHCRITASGIWVVHPETLFPCCLFLLTASY